MRSLYTWNIALWFVVYIGVPTMFYVLFRLAATGKRFEHPACAACRYQLGGVCSAFCPECGTNVSRTGTVMYPRRRWWTVVGQILALGALCYFGQMFVAAHIISLMPAWVQTHSSISLAPPDMRGQYFFDIRGSAFHWQSRTGPSFEHAPAASMIEIWFYPQPSNAYPPFVLVNRKDDTYTTVAKGVWRTHEGSFGHKEAVKWLQSLPAEISAGDASAYADIFMRVFQDNVDFIDVSSELNPQQARGGAAGTSTLALRNYGDYRGSRLWSDEILAVALVIVAGVLWLWLSLCVLRAGAKVMKRPQAPAE